MRFAMQAFDQTAIFCSSISRCATDFLNTCEPLPSLKNRAGRNSAFIRMRAIYSRFTLSLGLVSERTNPRQTATSSGLPRQMQSGGWDGHA